VRRTIYYCSVLSSSGKAYFSPCLIWGTDGCQERSIRRRPAARALRILASVVQTAVIWTIPFWWTVMKRIFLLVVLPWLSLVLTGCGYNDIQRLDEQVKAAWSQTLNQYERRAELVPKLVNSVNAYMVNERAVLTQVTEARSKVGSIQITAGDLQNPELMARFNQAQGELSSALSRLIAVSENYPQLTSDGLFRDLMTQLEGTENRIATERGRYVQAVQEYNLI